jgi:hypothetical protein
MPTLLLAVRQFNPQSQAALQRLNSELPQGMTAHSDGRTAWVTYEKVSEDDARASVRDALSSVDPDGLAGVSLP